MTIHTILAYASENDLPMSAITTNPLFDTKKGRVSKGKAIPHFKWTEKKRWEVGKTKKDRNGNKPTAWYLYLKKNAIYVIDIDVKNGLTAKDVLTEEAWTGFFNTSKYIVETGSKGIHVYYSIPIDCEVKDSINVDLNHLIKEEHKSVTSIDIITDHIICEGSSYEYETQKYEYTALKGDIYQTIHNENIWNAVSPFITIKKETIEEKQERSMKEVIRSLDYNEIIDHIDNIPNVNSSWEQWYKMGQLIYNILGSEGLQPFITWSSKNESNHSDKSTIDLWKGLSERQSGSTLTIGSLLYLSKQSNEDNYKKIRAKYEPLSYTSIKLMIEENHFFIEEPNPLYCRIRDRDIITYKPSEFSEILKPYNVIVNDKLKSFFDLWSRDNTRRTYKRFGFYPDGNCPSNEYNRFVPAEASFLPVKTVPIDPIMHHFHIMSGEDEKAKEFLIDFFAQIVQQPAKIIGVAILLYGIEGCGKDILVDWIGKRILGYHQYNKPGNIANMFKGFNSELAGNLLFHTDEIELKVIKKYNEDLKRVLTSGRIRIEGKGKDAISIDSYIRLFMTTNNRDALVISATDRRFAVFRSSDKYRNNMEYFKKLESFLEEEGVARSFYDFLMARDISQFDHTKRPETEIYKEMKQSSMNPILQWISNDTFDETKMKSSEWLVKYNNWAEMYKGRIHNLTSFGTAINDFASKNIGIVRKVTMNCKELTINKEEVLNYMEKEGLI